MLTFLKIALLRPTIKVLENVQIFKKNGKGSKFDIERQWNSFSPKNAFLAKLEEGNYLNDSSVSSFSSFRKREVSQVSVSTFSQLEAITHFESSVQRDR